MPGDYHVLAGIHNEIQMGEFSKQMTGHLLDYAQRNNWLGRHITDLGCGTGESLLWLTQHGYIVSGVDESAKMLTLAQDQLDSKGLSANLSQGNILTMKNISDQDMILSLNVLSELNNIRELEQVFKQVNAMLRAGKWFVFDMYTIEGLIQRNQAGHHLEYDNNGLTIFANNLFDYEKSIQTRHYIIFKEQSSGWQREEAERTLRAYPIQGVTALVQRSGFAVQHVLNVNMTEHKPSDPTSRVIIFAEKR